MKKVGNDLLAILLFVILTVAIITRIHHISSLEEMKAAVQEWKNQAVSMHWAEEGVMDSCLWIADKAGAFANAFKEETVSVMQSIWSSEKTENQTNGIENPVPETEATVEAVAANAEYDSWADCLYERIPILMYHVVEDAPNANSLYISPEFFQRQLDYLEAQGAHPITMDQLYRHWTSREKLPPNPIVLTFDDGYRSMYTEVFPRLQQKGWQGVFYVYTQAIGRDTNLTYDMIREMSQAGMEIGSHTVNHLDMSTLSESQMIKELTESKTELEKITNIGVVSFCYPSGRYNQTTVKKVREAGYHTAVTTEYGVAHWKDDFYTLCRIRINGEDDEKALAGKIQSVVADWNQTE